MSPGCINAAAGHNPGLEFNLDPEKMKDGWYVYGTHPGDDPHFKNFNSYWTRITQTDYTSHDVELHCSDKIPSENTLQQIDAYLQSVRLSRDQFIRIKQLKDCQNKKHAPLQTCHLSSYNYLNYNPHYVRPLAQNPNI